MFRALNLVIYFTTSDTVLVIMLLPIVLMGKTVTPEMVFLPLGWINILKLRSGHCYWHIIFYRKF